MKNKMVIVLGIIIFISLIGSLYLMINYNLENNEDYVESYCQSWADKNKIITPSCVGHWERNNGCEWVCESEDFVGGCAGVSSGDVQECCSRWAEENDVARIMCVGSWVVENNSCKWECDAS